MMKQFQQVQVESRAELRTWLMANQDQTDSIWSVTFKKGKGPYLAYDAIVEEAICFGWIERARPGPRAPIAAAFSLCLNSSEKRSKAVKKGGPHP